MLGLQYTLTHTHTLSAYPLADLCKVSPTEALGHLGNVRKINVCSNRGLTEVGLENGEAGLQGRLRERNLASQRNTTRHLVTIVKGGKEGNNQVVMLQCTLLSHD